MFDSRLCECVCKNQKRGAAAAVVIRKLSFFLPFFFFLFLLYMYMRVYAYMSIAYTCMYARTLRTYDRRFDILTMRFTIRNNICIGYFFAYIFSIRFRFFRQCFGTFWSWLTVRATYPCIRYIIYILYVYVIIRVLYISKVYICQNE